MEKQITISRNQLKNLLFWAISGYTDSNGGTGEKYISKIIAHYVKELDMKKSEFPPMGIKSLATLTGNTKANLLKDIKIK